MALPCLIDALPNNQICDPPLDDILPFGLHYQALLFGTIFFSKQVLPPKESPLKVQCKITDKTLAG
jgi:hypothetical protein